MYVILPFEKQFYEEKHNFPVHFVGHPLIDAIGQFSWGIHSPSEKNIIWIPGLL
jgi:lipid A disaccharide synthetase